jgi:hypothetical protein
VVFVMPEGQKFVIFTVQSCINEVEYVISFCYVTGVSLEFPYYIILSTLLLESEINLKVLLV